MTRLPSALRPLFPWLKAGVLQATQAVSPLTRRLPGPTPPRHVAPYRGRLRRARIPTAASRSWRWPPRRILDRPLPAGLPADHPQFAAHRREHIAANVVATVRNGRVLAPYGAIITEDDTLLFDLSPYYGVAPAVAASRLPAPPPARRQRGARLRGRPHDAGERELLPLPHRRPARGSSCCGAPARHPTRIVVNRVDPVPARPARSPRPDRRPLPRRRQVSACPGRRARGPLAARRRPADAALDRAVAPLPIPARPTCARRTAGST